ncbi:IS256 family transposase [Lewinella sp. 4G2]|uniref:IS256 family transposase n=2 Tax=Lewinella sp. 4G2 TaxID=1803372 RepID=UPI0007E14682|nr:IS256 family transposase [Lewinella sp. 4G2]OAV45058.1 hypothetical protein A3850_011420 [Lewinella sp. 4G2]
MAQTKSKTKASEFDFEAYRTQVVQGFIKGQALTGQDGLLKPLIAQFIEAALAAEMDDHLADEAQRGLTNKRNGQLTKEVQTTLGAVDIDYSRDRAGRFEPVTVRKRSRQLALGFEEQIIELYASGSSLEDITRTLSKLYGAEMSTARISGVINATWQTVEDWHRRRLPACLVVLFIDAIHIDVRREHGVAKVALYVAYGITLEGKREVIGLIPGQGTEGAVEWARCLESFKQRGLEDVLITCSDGLAGLKSVIAQTWPQTQIQRCVVHKIRNTFRLLDDKDSKQVLRQLKEVYNAVNEAEASRRLEDFGNYWQGKYDLVVALWRKDWDELMTCMKLSPALKKLTYTTNAIENLNREIRRVVKTKGAWPNDRSLLIQLYHSLDRKRDSWNKSVLGWSSIHRELCETFGERYTKHFN